MAFPTESAEFENFKKITAVPPQHELLKPIWWLEGTWRTENLGTGRFPTINPFNYCKEIRFVSYGQPMMSYYAQSWHPSAKETMFHELGFVKIEPGTNKLSLFGSLNFRLPTIESGEVKGNLITLFGNQINSPTDGSVLLQSKHEFKLVNGCLHESRYLATKDVPQFTEKLKVVYKKLRPKRDDNSTTQSYNRC